MTGESLEEKSALEKGLEIYRKCLGVLCGMSWNSVPDDLNCGEKGLDVFIALS